VDDAPEGHALFLDGDANFHTGVYYGSPFDGTSGLAVKAELSTPATRRQWQTFTTAFAFTVNTRALRQWDHTSGYVWARERLGSPAHLCEFDYPLSNESPGTLDTMSMGSTGPKPSAAAPRALSSGAWYTLLLQVFPDGRCGAAVNGEASLLSASMRLPLDSLYLMFIARSVQTRMLLGRVEVYRGIVPGIAWEHVGLEGHVPVLHLKNKREP
jgi:hypothetical protein